MPATAFATSNAPTNRSCTVSRPTSWGGCRASPLTWRDRRLANLKPEQITKLVITKNAVATVVARGTDAKWRLVAPAQGALDVDALRIWSATLPICAREFLSLDQEAPPAPAWTNPLTITATAGDRSYTLRLGQPKDAASRYAAWSEPALVCTLPAATVETLTKDLVTTAAAATNATPATSAVTIPPPPAAAK